MRNGIQKQNSGEMLAKFSTHRTPTLRFSSPLTFQVSTDSHLLQGVPNFDHAMATTPMKRLRCCGTFHNFLSVCGILSKQWPPFLILKLPNPHDVHLTLFSTDSTSVRKLATGWPPIPRNGIATAVGNRGTKRRKFPQDLASRGVVARRAHLCAFIVLYSCS